MANRIWILQLLLLFFFAAFYAISVANAAASDIDSEKATSDEDKLGKQGNMDAFHEKIRAFKEDRNLDDEEKRLKAEEIFGDARRGRQARRNFDKDEHRQQMERRAERVQQSQAEREKRRAERREQMRDHEMGSRRGKFDGVDPLFDERTGAESMDFDPRDPRFQQGRRGKPRPPIDPRERRRPPFPGGFDPRRQRRPRFDRQTRDEL